MEETEKEPVYDTVNIEDESPQHPINSSNFNVLESESLYPTFNSDNVQPHQQQEIIYPNLRNPDIDTEQPVSYPVFSYFQDLASSNNMGESFPIAEKSMSEAECEESLIEIEDKGETKMYNIFGYGFISYHTFQISLVTKTNTKLLSFRRYKHFVMFDEFLRKKYPYLLFPELPPKSILGNISINSKSKEELEKERVFGLGYFLNYIYKLKNIGESIEFKKFLYDAYFDENYFDQIQPFYTFPKYEPGSIKKSVLDYFSNLFTSNKNLIVHNKEEMEILYNENDLRTIFNRLTKIKDQFECLERIYLNSDMNCRDLITDLLLFKDMNCFRSSDKQDLANYSKLMQNLRSVYYYNYENAIRKPLSKIREAIYLMKGSFRQVEILKDFLISFRKFTAFVHTNSEGEKYKAEYETLTIKKQFFLTSLHEELTSVYKSYKFIVEHYIKEFIVLYSSLVESERGILQILN